jgi:hypothetical protein
MTISVVFDPPLRADSPAVFNSKAFTLVGDLNTFSTQANSTASDINAQVTDPGVVAIGDDLIGANTIGAVAAIKADVSAVAAIKADVSAVAAIKADVSAVAANEANINAAVADLPSLAAKVSKTGDTMTGNLTVPSLNGGQLAGHRRRNLNGDCRIAQLGTSYPAANGRTIDMWAYQSAGAQVSTVTQEADAPAGSGFVYSHRSTVTTADAAIAASDYAIHRTLIEGFDVADFVGQTFTVSFRVRSAKAGVHCVALRNSGLDRSYVREFTIAAANTWETHKFTVTGGLPTGGTWNFTNGIGLEVDFTLAAGSTYHTTADAWQTGNFIATANQVNVLDTVGNIFAVTGLQIEPGDTATPYERRGIGAETTQVQRYGRLNGVLSGWSVAATDINGLAVDFSHNPMRATPTILLVNGTSAVHDPGVDTRNFSAPIFGGGSNIGGYVTGTVAATTANKLHNLLPGAVFFDARL